MRYLIAAVFATAGVALGAVNVWNNATQVNHGTFVVNDLTAVVCGLAAAGALLSLGLGAVAQRSRLTAALMVVAILGCSATSVGYTLGRVGGVADAEAARALAHNANLARAERLVSDLSHKRDAEAAKGGCGRECRKIETRLDAARVALAGLGARAVVDPAGERLAAATGGLITADAYRTAHPVIVAGTLELGVSLLLTIGGLFASGGRTRAKDEAPRSMIDITPPTTADPVIAALQQHKRPLLNQELARLAGVSDATAHRRVRDLVAAGRVAKYREGQRGVAIRWIG